MADNKDYVKMLIQVFLGFGLFLIGIVGAYFSGVGLYYGQAVVEGDVFSGAYKFSCNNANQTASECTSINTSVENGAYANYVTFTTNLNSTVNKFLLATFIAFSLLGLYFLFIALRGSGMWKGGSNSAKDRY